VDTLNAVFAREGLPPLSFDTGRTLIGGGVRTMIERGLKAEGRAVVASELDILLADFITHYTAHIADRSRPFPGLLEALDLLRASGWRFAVCTNKREQLAVLLLQQLGLADRFAAICGPDTFGVQKPDPDILRRTIEAAGARTQDAIMIGDSLTDIRTARAAGIPIIAVDFGYTDRPVSEFGPDRVIGGFADLPAAVAELCRSR
jgi:phosphoglycolate phosphatase